MTTSMSADDVYSPPGYYSVGHISESPAYYLGYFTCPTWLLSWSSRCCFSRSSLSFSRRCSSRFPRTDPKSWQTQSFIHAETS